MCPTDGRRDHQTDSDADDDGLTSGSRRESRTQERWMGTERVSGVEPGGPDGEREEGRPKRGKERERTEARKRERASKRSPATSLAVARRSQVRKSAGRRSGPRAIVCLNASMVDRLTASPRGRWRPLSTETSTLPACTCLSVHLLYASSA